MTQHAEKFAMALGAVLWLLLSLPAIADKMPVPVEAGVIEVVVTDLDNTQGSLMVALFDSADGYASGAEPTRQSTPKVTDASMRVRVDAVPYGVYAIKVFHDENSNEKLDTNFVGFPKEGFGFSNNAMGRMGPPSFDQAKFELASGSLRLEISMK